MKLLSVPQLHFDVEAAGDDAQSSGRRVDEGLRYGTGPLARFLAEVSGQPALAQIA
ncbi:hypothetical protein ACIPSA_46425 [Streptomyces sp. NPDC086549]|uniref:hypothetical protein n=1 Tax=Streptomyces sp. NPDC086549 TaxID=3365752 RepID=UPI0037FF1E31